MKKLVWSLLVTGGVLAGYLWWACPVEQSCSRYLAQRLGGAFRYLAGRQEPTEQRPGPQARDTAGRGSGSRSGVSSEVGKLWREPLTGMEFVRVPAGCFPMGSDSREPGRDRDEGPLHKVCLDGFWLGKHPVTRGQFRIFVEQNGYVTEAERQGYAWVYSGKWEKKPGYSWRRVGFPQDRMHPVVNVSWNDAKAMAAWLSAENQRTFSLPTEAQWEYACRAGSLTARYWGNGAEQACEYANIGDQSAGMKFPVWTVHPCRDGYVFTAPVGRFKSNDFGLYDMLGNVWEWCEDVYQPAAYIQHEPTNPVQVKGGRARVVRGGSWYSQPRFARCAGRDHLSVPSRRSQDQGFRLAIGP